MMQSAASAFPIGQYDAIAKTVLLPLFPLILVHRVFFFGVLFPNLRNSLFQIRKRLDLPRTFLCIYICFGAGISLTLSSNAKGIIEDFTRIIKDFTQIIKAESAEQLPPNPRGFSSPTACPLKSASRLHSHPRVKDQ